MDSRKGVHMYEKKIPCPENPNHLATLYLHGDRYARVYGSATFVKFRTYAHMKIVNYSEEVEYSYLSLRLDIHL